MQVTRYVHNYYYVDNVTSISLIELQQHEDEEQQQYESDLEDDGDDTRGG